MLSCQPGKVGESAERVGSCLASMEQHYLDAPVSGPALGGLYGAGHSFAPVPVAPRTGSLDGTSPPSLPLLLHALRWNRIPCVRAWVEHGALCITYGT